MNDRGRSKAESQSTGSPADVRSRRAQLTLKQQRFVEAYMGVARGNATEAARLAGYAGSDDTLRQTGSENLTKPHISAAIRGRVDADPVIADREARQRFWSAVMADGAHALRDRLKASELLGKSQGDFLKRDTPAVQSNAVQSIRIGDQIIRF